MQKHIVGKTSSKYLHQLMSDNVITSMHNPKVKQLVALQQKSSTRRQTGLFVVEGRREIMHALKAGYIMESVFLCPSLMGTGEEVDEIINHSRHCVVYEVSEPVYAKIAYRGTTEGVLAVLKVRHTSLEDLLLGEQPLLIVLEAVEKPGNLGAVLRSADAAKADAVVVCDPLTDIYNPNLIRSSIGAVFTVPCVACTSEECISFLKHNGIRILTAQLQDSKLYYDTDMRNATAIVMGTESTGLTNIWRDAADAHIRIPMLGQLDSLNVSVSAAILLFEAVRQRQTL